MSWRRTLDIIRRALFLPARTDRELDDEIRFHLAEEERLLAERGLAPDQAKAAARRAFGNAVLAKETTRAVWVWTALEQCLHDLRVGCRILTRSPAVSAAAISLVALVIGGNTTVFTIAHGILTKPSPGVHATDLLTVNWSRTAVTSRPTTVIPSMRSSWRRAPRSSRLRRSTSNG